MPNHFLKLSDFSGETLRYMLERAKVIKSKKRLHYADTANIHN